MSHFCLLFSGGSLISAYYSQVFPPQLHSCGTNSKVEVCAWELPVPLADCPAGKKPAGGWHGCVEMADTMAVPAGRSR